MSPTQQAIRDLRMLAEFLESKVFGLRECEMSEDRTPVAGHRRIRMAIEVIVDESALVAMASKTATPTVDESAAWRAMVAKVIK